MQKLRTAQDTMQKTSQKTILDQTFKLGGGGGISFRAPPVIKPLFPTIETSSNVNSSNAAYNVYAREKGKVYKLNKSPMPQNKAFNTGEYYINNTTARSFEIRMTGKQATTPDENLRRNAEQYRERKTKTALRFVEKEKYAINTSGEKQGLSLAKILKGKGGFRL